MSHRRAKRARREQRLREAAAPPARTLSMRRVATGGSIAAGAALLAVGLVFARSTGPAVPLTTFTPAEGAPAGATTPTGGPLELEGTNALTGRPINLRSLAGKPTVVTIWASWCHGCNHEGPAFGRFIRAHPEVGFFGINFQDTSEGAHAFVSQYGWNFPSIADHDGRLAFSLGLQGTPTTIFLDAQHREVTRIIGATDESGFEAALALAAA